jgi:ligand-binding sensor domain-containing protein/signal transduction histidine kinase
MFGRKARENHWRHGMMTLGVFIVSILFARADAPNYFIRTWQVEDGLPQNKVTAVVQTRDGYLWLSTYNGLARFDGVSFTVFDDNNTPELRSSRITSLCEAEDGALWIGDESGQITQYKEGRFKAVPFHPAWTGGKIYGIATDADHDVWVLNESGELARVRDNAVLTPPTGFVTKVESLTRSDDGNIWVSRDGRISLLEKGKLRAVEFEGMPTNAFVQGIGASHDGGLWVASDNRLRKWKDGKCVADLGAAPWGGTIVASLMETRGGLLCAGTSDNGLYLVFPGQNDKPLHFTRSSGLPSDWVISSWEDREGNVWLGTGAGLVMARRNNLETISPPDQWQGRSLLSVFPDREGALWVGTEGAGLYRYQNETWKNFRSEQGLRNPYVWSLAEDDHGRLWVGTWGGGLFAQNGDSFIFGPGVENLKLPVPALLAEGGDLWIGTSAGLLNYRDGTLSVVNQAAGDVRAIARDKQGAMWMGTAGRGLACLTTSNVCWYNKTNGLSSDFIECLHFDEHGALWIGTFGGGLNRFKDGRFATINHKQGLPNSVIGAIQADQFGFLWMSSYGGILRASETELNLCADGKNREVHFLTYGISDGMPTLECSEGLQPAGAKTADGRLWFPTAKGLVSVNPAHVQTNTLAPPVVIEAMRVDDRTVGGEFSSASLKIPPGRHRFEFQYTGLSFIGAEKVAFKYRLKGFDSDWSGASTKRVSTYNNLPPGTYSFYVIAGNNDGVWNETGARIAFQVLPYFWQTAWFRWMALIFLIAASGGAAWFDTRRRMRHKLERVERQRDIERERTRIARDIHDDLGAHLTRITMISESARADLLNPERAATGLARIYDTARELTRSMDEIVWAVNPRHDTLESLASYLEKFAQDLLATAGIRCRLDLPVQFPDWYLTSETRHNLFLASKEALHNVIKHSGASEAGIRLVIGEKSFELVIEDNGRGFDPGLRGKGAETSGRHSSGNGLENMTRRLSSIGGICAIQSAPGTGTKVVFTVQIKPAARR